MSHKSVVTETTSLAAVQAENLRLKERLERLMAEARANEEKLRRFDVLERKLIAAPSLIALLQVVLLEYPEVFKLNTVTLTLLDDQGEIAALLRDSRQPWLSRIHFLASDEDLQGLFLPQMRPRLGAFEPRFEKFFPMAEAAPQSCAFLPLIRLGRCVGSLNMGSDNVQRYTEGTHTDFLERLCDLFALCLDNVLTAERLKLAGLTDALTGVHNRRYFESRCEEEIQAARRSGLPLMCLMIDVDYFKSINDQYGHPAGDAVLRYVAKLIRVQLRGHDVVARYGGEEFVVLLPATNVDAARETAERIRRVIAGQSMPLQVRPAPKVTVSIGLAALGSAKENSGSVPQQMERMVHTADQALYRAKQTGRDRVIWNHDGRNF